MANEGEKQIRIEYVYIYIYTYNAVERRSGDEIKKRQRVSEYRRNLFDCPFAPRHVSLVPRFERLVETSRLWSDASRIYFRIFRNDHLSFFTLSRILTRSTYRIDDGGRKRFENVCHGTSPGNCPILD